jgi:DNA-binding beta-propeller fold protein YncE
VCAVDAASLAKGACAKLGAMPDGVFFVGATHEVWATTPREKSIVVLDAGSLAPKGKVTLEGEPEGYAVDEARGLVYTSLEDADRTLVLDARTRAVKATWKPGCGEDGPRGLALDAARGLLMVACTDHVVVLDAAHDGAVRGRLDTGPGLDNLDYVPGRHALYAAAGGAAKLTVATLDEHGALTPLASVPTAAGARNAVATADGTAYVADARQASILVVPPAR